MDQTELERCKNEVVYFAEKYFGIKLSWYQKIILMWNVKRLGRKSQ